MKAERRVARRRRPLCEQLPMKMFIRKIFKTGRSSLSSDEFSLKWSSSSTFRCHLASGCWLQSAPKERMNDVILGGTSMRIETV